MNNYVTKAQEVIEKIYDPRKSRDFDGFMTQLRKILNQMNVIYMKVLSANSKDDNAELSEDVMCELLYLKVRIVYQCRNANTYNIVETMQLLDKLDSVIKQKSIKEYVEFHRYVEAVIAYAKYYEAKNKCGNANNNTKNNDKGRHYKKAKKENNGGGH